MPDNLLAGISDPSQSEVTPFLGRPVDELDRSRFAAELAANPALRQHIMAVSAGENLDPTSNKAVLETMMNRSAMMGTPLAAEARLAPAGGYYAGYNPSALNHPATRAMIEQNLDDVLHGSNVSNYATDNSSGDFAARRAAAGMYTPTARYNGEWFTVPTRPDARGYGRYEQWRASLPSNQFSDAMTPEDRLAQVLGVQAPPSPAARGMIANAKAQAAQPQNSAPQSDPDADRARALQSILALSSLMQTQPTPTKRLPGGGVDFSGTSSANTQNMLQMMMRGRAMQNMLDALYPQQQQEETQ
jgi:hypothetical protein